MNEAAGKHRYLEGVELGNSGDPWSALREYFSGHRVDINTKTISALRRGETNGKFLYDRLACSDVLENGSSVGKTHFLETYADVSRTLRSRQIVDERKYSVFGFLDDVSSELGIREQTVRSFLLGFRADIAAGESEYAGSGLDESFVEIAHTYFDAYLDNYPSKVPSSIEALYDAWDCRSACSFYREMYQTMNNPSIGTFVPYEADFVSSYAGLLRFGGDRLSSLDRYLLGARRDGVGDEEVVSGVREKSGIPFTRNSLSVYRNVVAHGHVKIPNV